MNTLIKVLALGLIMILSATAVNAQKGAKMSPADKAQKETAAAVEALQLDEATAMKLSAINTKYADKIKNLNDDLKAKKKAGESVEKSAKKAAQKEIRKAKSKEIQALLGKAKGKEYKKFMKKYRKLNKKPKGMPKKGK